MIMKFVASRLTCELLKAETTGELMFNNLRFVLCCQADLSSCLSCIRGIYGQNINGTSQTSGLSVMIHVKLRSFEICDNMRMAQSEWVQMTSGE